MGQPDDFESDVFLFSGIYGVCSGIALIKPMPVQRCPGPPAEWLQPVARLLLGHSCLPALHATSEKAPGYQRPCAASIRSFFLRHHSLGMMRFPGAGAV